MKYLPDTNSCIALLRRRNPVLIARWRATPVRDMALSAVVIYELRYGAERSTDPVTEHVKVDAFLRPFGVIAFDENCAARCGSLAARIGNCKPAQFARRWARKKADAA